MAPRARSVAFYRLTGIRRVLSASDESLINEVMADCGYSRDEAIRRLWAFGGIGSRSGYDERPVRVPGRSKSWP